MISLQANNVYDVFKPMHFWSKIIGLTSFKIEVKKKVFVQSISCFNFLCILVSSTFFLVYGLWFTLNVEKFDKRHLVNSSSFFQNSMIIIALFSMFSTLLSDWWIFLMRKHFVRILNLFTEVDELLQRLDVPMSLRSQRIFILCFVFALKVLMIMAVFMTKVVVDEIPDQTYQQVFYVLMFIWIESNYLIASQFSFWMYAVKSRYQKINKFLQKNYLTQSGFCSEDEHKKLNEVSLLHDKLVDISECINRCYGLPVRTNV